MTRNRAEALILATSGTVWDVLTNADEYTVWGSGITAIKGEVRDRGILRVKVRGHGNMTYPFLVRLTRGYRMTWTFRLPLGLLTLRRTVILTNYSGMTRITAQDTAHGLLHSLLPDPDPDVSHFVDEVKFRAELLSFHFGGGIFPDTDDTKP